MIFFKKKRKAKRIGLALGGGGARGLAHIHVLETLDELGIRPHVISGTSIGSIMGALYASGLSGAEIRELVDRLLLRKIEKFTDVFTRRGSPSWLELLDPTFHRGALLKGERFVHFLAEAMHCTTFEELEIPMHISTTDFSSGTEAVFSTGDLPSAVRASMAIPGIFSPVERDGMMLVDGGLVNPLPYNLLRAECDVIIAVDICGSLKREAKRSDFFDASLRSFDIVQASLIEEQIRRDRPEIFLRPDLHGISILEFNKSDQILEQSAPIREELKRKLTALNL